MESEKIVPVDLIPENDKKDLNLVKKVFKFIFGSAVMVLTKNISKGGSSDIIYVPSGNKGKLATVIIWNKKPIYKDGNVEIKE